MTQNERDELMQDVAKSIREIAASLREMNEGLAIMRQRAAMLPRVTGPLARNANVNWLSGRWPRRDGNSYGIVAAQPPIQEPSPEPAVHADDPTGYLRSTDQR